MCRSYTIRWLWYKVMGYLALESKVLYKAKYPVKIFTYSGDIERWIPAIACKTQKWVHCGHGGLGSGYRVGHHHSHLAVIWLPSSTANTEAQVRAHSNCPLTSWDEGTVRGVYFINWISKVYMYSLASSIVACECSTVQSAFCVKYNLSLLGESYAQNMVSYDTNVAFPKEMEPWLTFLESTVK